MTRGRLLVAMCGISDDTVVGAMGLTLCSQFLCSVRHVPPQEHVAFFVERLPRGHKPRVGLGMEQKEVSDKCRGERSTGSPSSSTNAVLMLSLTCLDFGSARRSDLFFPACALHTSFETVVFSFFRREWKWLTFRCICR